MKEPLSLKDKLRLAFIEKDLSAGGWRRLAFLVVSFLAARAALSLGLTVLTVVGMVYWLVGRPSDSAEDLRRAEEARRVAGETHRMLDEAQDKAQAAQRSATIRKQEEELEYAVKTVVLAMVGYQTDQSLLTDNVDDLFNYGFRRNPDFIYDLRVHRGANGDPSFAITVSHREPGPRAFTYDPDSGRGVEPVGPEPAELAPAAAPAGLEQGYAAAVHQKKQDIEDQEFAVKTAIQQLVVAQMSFRKERGVYTSNYDDLALYYPWRPDPALVYGEMIVGRNLEGEPSFKVTIRHKDKGPRAFSYDLAKGRESVPVE